MAGLLAIAALAAPGQSREPRRVYDACEHERSGRLRLVDSPRQCQRGERAILLKRVDRARKPAGERDGGPRSTDRTPAPSRDREDLPRTEPPDASPPPPATRSLGAPCTSNAMCTSGHCTDNVCCDGPCTGSCQACSVSAGGSMQGQCTALVPGMDGGEQCAAQPDTTPSALRDIAETCAFDRHCSSGFCRDGRCCEDACAGACRACSISRGGTQNGVCTAIVPGGDPLEGC